MTMQTNTTSKPALAVSRGRIVRPQKAVIYGPEGVGKSTLAGGLPEPVFLDTEGGTHHLDVARLEAGPAWEEAVAAQVSKARADAWKCDCCGMTPVAVDTDNQMLLCTICAGRLVDAAQMIECAGGRSI